jgi:protein-L-isoaspartate(D-aspartate) O-methyltransferase
MFEQQREDMVRFQLIPRGISNPAILDAMRTTPRHEFVEEDLWPEAYGDFPVPIGFGQTISQPYIVAYMLELVRPAKENRLLEIGSGCGYLLGVASKLFREVVGIERVPGLYEQSLAHIQKLNLPNVKIFCGDGYEGVSEAKELFESIILSCSCSAIPAPLLEQLSPGGLLVAPVGDAFSQELLLVQKKLDGTVTSSQVGGVRFVPLISPHETR